MSRYATTFIIFTAVTALVIISQSFIISRCDSWLELTEETNYFIQRSQYTNAAAALKEMSDNIESEKKLLMMFLEHEKCEELSAKVARTLNFVKNEEKNLASAELAETRNIIEDLKASQRMSAENIV